jgi:hypothetical protein
MSDWDMRPVELNFRLGELTLARWTLPLQVKAVRLHDDVPVVGQPQPPPDALTVGSRGFLVRGQPIRELQRPLLTRGNFICYAQNQYRHYYIDLRGSFETYKTKFSSKTRSTIARKLKKYSNECGGAIDFRVYSLHEQMLDFFHHARAVSAKSYQERLLDAGLPNDEYFLNGMLELARRDEVRGYVLFHGERPISYLYCPAKDGVLLYSYLGYDSDYRDFSPGTVLQWLVLKRLFEEQRFCYFDFSEGETDHKHLFSTHDRLEANFMFLKRNLFNVALVHAHFLFGRFAASIGTLLENAGLKSRVRRMLRFRWSG